MIWFDKSKRTWKAAFAILKETKMLCLINESGTEYKEVQWSRWRRESRRRNTAYKLAQADGYKRHPDYYWYEARKAMIMADRLAKKEWQNI